jgi:hypothetical protein
MEGVSNRISCVIFIYVYKYNISFSSAGFLVLNNGLECPRSLLSDDLFVLFYFLKI